MKKILLSIFICVGIICSMNKVADAKDIYIFTKGNMEYYITYADNYSMDGNTGFLAYLVGVQNDKAADRATYVFFYGKTPKYIVTDGHSKWECGRALRMGYYREYDYVANNSYAQTLYNYWVRR